MKIRVILADDHPIVREGVKAVIEKSATDIDVVGAVADGRRLLELARERPADVYVLDIAMPGLNGIETARRLMALDPEAKVVVLSIHDNRTFVEKSLQNGVRGYVLKDSATDELVQAIREVYAGRCFLSPAVSRYVIDGFLGKTPRPSPGRRSGELTPREREILQLVAEGKTSKDIAIDLDLAVNTVHVHRNNIMKKLDLHTQAELIRFALKEGIAQL